MENAGNLIEDEELRSQIKGTGIGTSATRGEILKKLSKIGYIDINKFQIVTPCNLGEMVYEVVRLTIPEMLNPELSAIWDKELEEIADGTISFSSYKIKLDNYIKERTNKIKNEDKLNDIASNIKGFATGSLSNEESNIKCPCCNKNLIINKWYYQCSCGFKISHIICEKDLSEQDINNLINNKRTGLIKGFTSKTGEKFAAYLVMNDNNKIKFEFSKA